MPEISEERKARIFRLDLVSLYWSKNMAVTTFAQAYNAGGINGRMLEETGPVEAEDLDRWADICMGVVDQGEGAE